MKGFEIEDRHEHPSMLRKKFTNTTQIREISFFENRFHIIPFSPSQSLNINLKITFLHKPKKKTPKDHELTISNKFQLPMNYSR